jgi:hypothetical protein
MKFEIEHRFDASPRDVLSVLTDPNLPEALVPNMENLIEMEFISADGPKRQVRYRPIPMIKRIGPKKVEPRWMEWIEHSTTDSERYVIEFENIPRVGTVAKMMLNRGTIYLRRSGEGCLRTVEGELKIKVPFLGRIAEKMIYRHAKALLDEEAGVTGRIVSAGGVKAFLENS